MNNTPVDTLNRQPQIKYIKGLIDEADASYTIAIDGNWGCGKTVFLRYLQDLYDDTAFTFYYDAWANNYYDEPVIGLLDCIRLKLNEINAIENNHNAYVKIALDFVVNFFDIALESKIGFKPISTIKKTKNYINKQREASKIGDDFNPYSESSNAKVTIVKALNELKNSKKVIIFIDELDRCDPRYSMKVLERIHHISENSNVIIVIATDKKQLERSIQNIYFSNNHNERSFSDNYLRKIVDITYDLGNGVFDQEKRKEIFGDVESLFLKCDEIAIKESDLLDFEARLFNNLEIRKIKKMIKQTISNHKIIFGENEKLSPILMCGELLLNWGLLNVKDKSSLLSEMASAYDKDNDPNSIYSFIKENFNGFVTSYNLVYSEKMVNVIDMPSFLFYLIKAANRKTMRAQFSHLITNGIKNDYLISRYLPLILKTQF